MIYLCRSRSKFIYISRGCFGVAEREKHNSHTQERERALRIIIKMTKCNFGLRAGVITRDAREPTTKLGALKTIYTPQPKVLKRRRRTATAAWPPPPLTR